jgi:hypothetical protein
MRGRKANAGSGAQWAALARETIDRALVAAGWLVQDFAALNLAARRGVRFHYASAIVTASEAVERMQVLQPASR